MKAERNKRLQKVIVIFAIVAVSCALIYFLHPPCAIKKWFGVYCPACGTQRMIDSILALDFKAAFLFNPFMFVALPVLTMFTIFEAIKYVRKGKLLNRKWEIVFLIVVLVLAVVFAVLRNILDASIFNTSNL